MFEHITWPLLEHEVDSVLVCNCVVVVEETAGLCSISADIYRVYQNNISFYYIAINMKLLKLRDKSRVTSVHISADICTLT